MDCVFNPYRTLDIRGWALGNFAPCDVAISGARVLDLTVRTCQRAPAENWPLKFAVFRTHTSSFWQDEVNSPWECHWYVDTELLRYETDAFFGRHTDTVKGAGHIGTLLYVITDGSTEGGDLLVYPPDGTAAARAVCPDKGVCYIGFVPLGWEHEVTCVTAGSRHVAKASVYAGTGRALYQHARSLVTPGLQD